MNQKHKNVTHIASTDPLASPEYTPKENFATSPKPNFCNVNSSDNPNKSDHHKKFSGLGWGRTGERNRGKQVYIAHVRNLAVSRVLSQGFEAKHGTIL
jgi:hypothetical protein